MTIDEKSFLKDISRLTKEDIENSPLLKSIVDSWKSFGELLTKNLDDSKLHKVSTHNEEFVTTIAVLDFDVVNTFPKNPPKADDVYWIRHNEIVDNIIDKKKEIILKSIEVAGETTKGLINPLNLSTIDWGKLAENISKD